MFTHERGTPAREEMFAPQQAKPAHEEMFAQPKLVLSEGDCDDC